MDINFDNEEELSNFNNDNNDNMNIISAKKIGLISDKNSDDDMCTTRVILTSNYKLPI